MAVLGSHEFELRIGLLAQGGSQIIAGREDLTTGSAVLSKMSGGFKIELSEFEVENARLKCDCLRKIVEIVIGGVQTVVEIQLICLFMSLCRLLLQCSV